jgi:hypothetical protein
MLINFLTSPACSIESKRLRINGALRLANRPAGTAALGHEENYSRRARVVSLFPISGHCSEHQSRRRAARRLPVMVCSAWCLNEQPFSVAFNPSILGEWAQVWAATPTSYNSKSVQAVLADRVSAGLRQSSAWVAFIPSPL